MNNSFKALNECFGIDGLDVIEDDIIDYTEMSVPQKHTEDIIESISLSLKEQYENGRVVWNKGKKIKEVQNLSYSGKYKRGIRSCRKNHKNGKKREFLSPDNNVVVVNNLKCFCEENFLSYSGMMRVVNNGQKEYKGWTLYKPAQNT